MDFISNNRANAVRLKKFPPPPLLSKNEAWCPES
jgi:hypothetical protein